MFRIPDGPTRDAVQQILDEARRIENAPGYEMVSVRSLYTKLAMTNPPLDEVLRAISDAGFNYCLDHTIRIEGHNDARGEFPHRDVCYWGADQLRSRLSCVL
jgi:hypothetical protein